MSDVTVVAKLVVQAGSVDQVKAELLKLLTLTRLEDGCIQYNLHQDNEDPAVFVFYETWQSLACLEKHMNSDHFKRYINAVGSMIAEKVVHKMIRIE